MCIAFDFGEGFTILDCVENMKLYVYNIEESYEYTIIVNLVNSGTTNLILHIVQCLHACSVNEENKTIPLVPYCSNMMYKYNDRLGFLIINTLLVSKGN